MSWISHRKRMVFIHNERTGGNTYTDHNDGIIDIRFPLHDTVEMIQNKGYFCPGYDWIMFVRNPFDRCVSWYELEKTARSDLTFRSFIMSEYRNKPTQMSKLKIVRPIKMHIIWFESYLWPKGIHINKSNRKPYREYFDEETRAMVEQRVEVDLKSFGYEY